MMGFLSEVAVKSSLEIPSSMELKAASNRSKESSL